MVWLAGSLPIVIGVIVASIPGVLVAVISETWSRRRDRKKTKSDEQLAFRAALREVVSGIANLAEVRANPLRNSSRDGEVSARFRMTLAEAQLLANSQATVVLTWLTEVAARINVGDSNWTDLDRLDKILVEPILQWQRGAINERWFSDQMKYVPVRPEEVSAGAA